MRGQVFTINSKKFFTFGGASSIDIARRTENIDWWRDELPNYREMNEGLENLEKHNFEIDYILTHTCSAHSIENLYKNSSNFLKNTSLSPITKQNLEKFSNSISVRIISLILSNSLPLKFFLASLIIS